ncbi:MAG: AmmeMemoRadiSam system protein B [Nitrospinota bacterium]
MQNPKLRSDIDVMPVEVDGKKIYAVSDTLGLIKGPIGISEDILEVMILLDGTRSLEDIRAELARMRSGESLRVDEVERIVSELDSAMILENGNYLKGKAGLIRTFVESPVREAFLSGKAYPGTKPELEAYLGGILRDDEEEKSGSDTGLIGLVAPHIDLEVGKEGYRAAYRQIVGYEPERVVILGTGHRVSEGLFSLTKKDFETPLGLLENDKEAVSALEIAGAGLISKNDFDHRNEHSIEFQALFLKYLFKEKPFKIIPVLCGDISAFPGRYSSFSQVPGVTSFCSALKNLIEDTNCLVVAGVDLSHIGPKFGNQQPASELDALATQHDMESINAVSKKNNQEFWSLLEKGDKKYNVCGASSLATLLEIMPDFKGNIAHYTMWHEESTLSAVSFCSMGLSPKGQD